MLAKKENQQPSTEAPALDTGKVLAMVKGIGRVNQTGNRDWIEDRLLNTILETGALELKPHLSAHLTWQSIEDRADSFVALITRDGPQKTEQYIAELLNLGMGVDSIVLELIPRIARKLGDQWISDSLSFTEVTIATGRLQKLIYSLDHLFQETRTHAATAHTILVSAAPGSHHTLGPLILSNYFTWAGWNVLSESMPTQRYIETTVASKSLTAIALSVADYDQLDQLPTLIQSIRNKSLNPAIIVLTGGSLYNSDSMSFGHIKADIKSNTPEEALHQINRILNSTIEVSSSLPAQRN
jgi:MerR family transcriptional regulator, light-induced transcriptional regulator